MKLQRTIGTLPPLTSGFGGLGLRIPLTSRKKAAPTRKALVAAAAKGLGAPAAPKALAPAREAADPVSPARAAMGRQLADRPTTVDNPSRRTIPEGE
ncbi:MAG: hypothetical protein ACHP7H_00810 [Hyphomicrobiales bacterium]